MSSSSHSSQKEISAPSQNYPKRREQLSSSSHRNISVDTLVSHLLASKLSLASIKMVWRAKEIVISAREALEESAILSSRSCFLLKGFEDQIKTLQKLRVGIEATYDEGQKDFKSVIKTLDAANERLEATMNTLRSTMVELAFRPKDEEPRYLLDFVDEQGVEIMRNALKEHIREAKAAQTELDSVVLSLDDDLMALKAAIKDPEVSRSITNSASPIPEHLQSLESHAEEMAGLLESLVQHFDLCVTAIRNTEGGTAAARKAASSQFPGIDAVSVSGVMSTENILADEEPVSEEEMEEILDVLEKDAAQVDDVVMELRGLLADMEIKHQGILDYVSSLYTSYEKRTSLYNILEIIGSRLRGYILASHDFSLRWDETKASINSQLSELESIRLFYENYYSSYDGLILEVQRRRQCQDKTQAILRKALDQLDCIYEADMREREEFRADVGEYLPVDLWPGVGDVTPRWEFTCVSGTENAVPLLSSGVIERAAKRAKQRERSEEA